MTHRVILTKRAQQDAYAARDWWAEHRSARQAARWYDVLIKKLALLEKNTACGRPAPESDSFPLELRQLEFGVGRSSTHRIVFTIRPDAVVVLRVRHLAQDELSPGDV